MYRSRQAETKKRRAGFPDLRRLAVWCIGCWALLLVSLAGLLVYSGEYRWQMTRSVKAIDSANIVNDQAWFDQAYADGVRLYVMHSVLWDSCEPWPKTEPQLAMAVKAGLKIAVYTRNPACWENGILAAGAYRSKLQFFAIDIETDPGVPATLAMVAGIKAMGVRPVIYSGSGMWDNVMGESADKFSGIPLWDCDAQSHAHSEWKGNVLFPPPVRYGGWNTASNMRIGVQQRFEYSMNGVAVDLNSFDESFLR
jgi:hypothetical protein